jgi:transcription-repair coupling factor (superfamily II helicase)
MSLGGLKNLIADSHHWKNSREKILASRKLYLNSSSSFDSFLVSDIAKVDEKKKISVAIFSTDRLAERFLQEINSWDSTLKTLVFPALETLPHETIKPTAEVVGKRNYVLQKLAGPLEEKIVIATSIAALMQPIPKELKATELLAVGAGQSIDFLAFVTRLVELGYQREELVQGRGDFAVRGGIIDIFPPQLAHPIRIEFFSDEIEEIRFFSLSDQRTIEVAKERVEIPSLIYQAESYENFSNYLTEKTRVFFFDPEKLKRRAEDVIKTDQEFIEVFWQTQAEAEIETKKLKELKLLEFDELEQDFESKNCSIIYSTSLAIFDESSEFESLDLKVRPSGLAHGNTLENFENLKSQLTEKNNLAVVVAGAGLAQRVLEQAGEFSIPAGIQSENEFTSKILNIYQAELMSGFEYLPIELTVLNEKEIFGQKTRDKDTEKLPTRRRKQIDVLTLTPGDFLVHEQHGIGKYLELQNRKVANVQREYLVIEFAASKRGQPSDRLYLPTDQLDQITKYVGGESPALSKLGGSDWEKTKGRARKAVKQIAAELIRLYSIRQTSKGFAFSQDTPWQKELEDAFAFVETPDQLSSIEDVKRDMEKPFPMDRVIAGDVGYGKTEIAVRAAFKAAQDGKQVAVLVPTTLLAQQHFQTFSERFAAFPIKTAVLSRFQSKQQITLTLEEINLGKVDVVIGTHRLLTHDVKFKDLGLVIVDEEQRFGVEHKEHLKALRTNVDVLSMSATPIPRTLEMAITGIREMSVIQTPPEERLPILTAVGPSNDHQIAAAIRRELIRDGQVFYVHNRVESIDRLVSKLKDLVPEARVAVAHGKMNESQLEQVILDFWEKKFDVLVSTTIVESGLDIPNANTLIVDRADTFGLSQLHQIRGRVGRGRERAYAYFLFDPKKTITETAHERLKTIAQNTDLGSGMAVAMKDLEIRGAGNILGQQQSGHIAEVGFDLYVRLISEAISKAKGEDEVSHEELRIELGVEAYIPESFISHERLRLEAYKSLSEIQSAQELVDFAKQLADRYGNYPPEVNRLMEVASLRILARRANLTEVILTNNKIKFAPVSLPDSRSVRLTRLYPGSVIRPMVRTILIPAPAASSIIPWAQEVITSVILGEEFEKEISEKIT